MKTNLFFTFCLLVVFGWGMPIISNAADNLLVSSDMESQGSWSHTFLNTEEANRPTFTWGYTADKPAGAAGGVLRVTATNAAGQAQYCIYQKITLSADATYEVDALLKTLNHSQWKDTWFEVFIGAEAPVDGQDYGGGNALKQIASFNTWGGAPNGDATIKQNAGAQTFTPAAAGDYYFILKVGCLQGGSFDLLMDNISFKAVELPVAAFSVNHRAGFNPLTVTFNNTSQRATSCEWDFGDGSAKVTETNPTHTYANPGNYKVTLKAINGAGNNVAEKDNLIQVKAFPGVLAGGGKLQGGNMEDQSKWNISTLNSPAEQMPTATWNYTTDKPVAGQGGALRIQGSATNTTLQYCIYQKVTLDHTKIYRFNAAFKDLSLNLWHFWTEIFISESEPANGTDFGAGAGTTQLVALSNWDDMNSLNRGLDGTYQVHASVKEFIPATSGDYFFVFKTGVYVGAGESAAFDILLDEVILEEVTPKPYTSFTATNSQGFSPLEVAFTNTTQFATSYLWSFGDGQTSTDENPKHTYNTVGKYTVSLKATNAKGDSTLVKTNFVSVNERPQLPEGEKLYGGNMENGGYWYTARIGGANPVTPTWNYTENIPTGASGGALRLQMSPPAGQGSNIALYQPVTMKNDYVYTFDCLFKAIGATDNLWIQVYITDVKPNDTDDPNKEEYTPGQLNTWSDGSIKTYDGPFSGKAGKGGAYTQDLLTYHYTGADGATMYFILKIGTWEKAADIVLDNLSLKESLNLKADFSADATESDNAPFTVQFFDMSVNATSWLWNFGDGQTSTLQDPEHTYTQTGTYTVTLTSYNGALSKTKTIINMIKVGVSAIDHPEIKDINIFTEEGKIVVKSENEMRNIAVYNINGILLEANRLPACSYTSGDLSAGVYVLRIDGQAYKAVVK